MADLDYNYYCGLWRLLSTNAFGENNYFVCGYLGDADRVDYGGGCKQHFEYVEKWAEDLKDFE